MAERASALRRRMRVALLWAAALFLSLQLAIGVILDFVCPLIRFPSAAEMLAYLKQCPAPPEIVCLGSSRFGSGILTDTAQDALGKQAGLSTIPVVFNASTPWGDLITADFVLKQVLRAGVTPRLLLVEVSWESLQRRNRWIHAHLYRELRWQDLTKCVKDIKAAGQMVRLLAARLLPFYVYRHELGEQLEGCLPDETDAPAPSAGLDWQKIILHPSLDSPAARATAMQKDRRMVAGWLSRYDLGGYAVACLEDLLQTSRQHGIEVILLGVPVSSDYRSLVPPEIETVFRTTIDGICRKYGCRFVDYRARIPDELFVDIHHLKEEGAVQFSELLGREVLAPAWAELND